MPAQRVEPYDDSRTAFPNPGIPPTRTRASRAKQLSPRPEILRSRLTQALTHV